MIGILDSGIGGLGMFQKIKYILPDEDILYFADTKNVPYGNKDIAFLKKIILENILKMEKMGCDLIVIACNTATVNGLDYYRKYAKVSLIGTVPVIKTAAHWTQNNTIALLATPRTVNSKYTDNLIKKFAKNKTVIKIPCEKWVDAIEANKATPTLLKKDLDKIKKADIVILGCTHYTLIKGPIQRVVGPDVKVLDSNEAVARHVLRIMNTQKLFKPKKKPKYIFECTGPKAQLMKNLKNYLCPKKDLPC